ncbi:MAG: flagellar protein FlaG [Bryobacteraceae bacterium]
MEISAVNRTDPVVSMTAVSVPSEIASQNREVIQSVKALNGSAMFGQDEELDFQMDSATKRMVVRVINSNTKEVISQIPPEYVLNMAQNLRSP